MAYRPRGTLARALYDKIRNDNYLEGYDMRLVSRNNQTKVQTFCKPTVLCND